MVFTTGIIGYGARGEVLGRIIRDHVPEMELIAVADSSPERRTKASEAGLSAYYNAPDLLTKEKPQVVVISTNASSHYQLVLLAAQHGCHIVCEKPLAYAPEDADEMAAAIRRAGVMCAVDYETVFADSFGVLGERLKSPEFGRLLHIDGTCKGRAPAYDMETDLPHFLYSLMGLVGSVPEKVFARITVDGRNASYRDIMPMATLYPEGRADGIGMRADVIEATYVFPGGVTARFFLPKVEKPGSRLMQLVFYGTHGRVRFHETAGGYVYWSSEPQDTPSATDWNLAYAPSNPDTMWTLPTARLLHDFLDAIKEGRTPVANVVAAASIVDQVTGIYASHLAGGQEIALPLRDRRHPLSSR